jgi:quercetin dioxygenase-like cupin family protein
MSSNRVVSLGGSRVAVASALLLVSATALAQSDGERVNRADIESPVVPVHEEPHHREVFQYGTTRILDLRVPPGDISWFHSHEWPVLYMTLGTSRVRTQNLGDDWGGGGGARPGGAQTANAPSGAQPNAAAGGPRAAGAGGGSASPPAAQAPPVRRTPRATSTTSYVDRPVTHRIENIGEGLFSAMVVVNETNGDDSTSVADAGFDSEPELTNPWFRSYRVTLAAGEETGSHEHTTPVVIFQAIDGKAIANGPMSFELNRPGQWAFYDVGVAHTMENLGDAAVELLEIEVRRK